MNSKIVRASASTGITGIIVLMLAAASFVFAQSPLSEESVAWTAVDTSLQWGPCPEFLPEGCAIAILHGDPAQENVDIFFKLPGNSEFALHTHTSAERMVLVAGELHVTYEGEKMRVLRPGAYAYGPPQKPHSGSCASTEPCILFIAFESPLDATPVTD